MNKWIVVTTINPPTKAILRLSELTMKGWRCVVVGDRKTPIDWMASGIDYIDVAAQEAHFGDLASLIPFNHYCRKNLGYLYAIENGADVILETDDDNIPKPSFSADPILRVTADLVGGSEWSNVYKHFTDQLIWPRGNPLNTIHEAGTIQQQRADIEAPIQQSLADGDPDVDAIYRLLFKDRTDFNERTPIALAKGTWCSFNSQNTIFFKEAFPLLYLPCHVSFRMTDIWRSFVAQAALWSNDRNVVFKSATVVQERNEHNLMKDFRDEVDGYLGNEDIARELSAISAQHRGQDFGVVATACWSRLQELGVVSSHELQIFDAWLQRCNGKL